MKFEEENYARDLNRELRTHGPQGAKVHLHGNGNQWSCIAVRGHRTASVACLRRTGETPGPEFAITFQQYNLETAVGRVFTLDEAVAATTFWLDGHPIEILYKRFPFVDSQQRALRELEKALLAQSPELAETTTHELRRIVHEIYYLWFVAKERSCRISFPGQNPQPDAHFFTEGTELFHFPVSGTEDLAAVIQSWLADEALLSQIHTLYPWIEISEQSLHYEAHAIEGKFLQRWNAVTHYYQNGKFPLAPQILALVTEMRWGGYDRKLNVLAGEARLLVARSRGNAMSPENPYILFTFHEEGMEVYNPGSERITLPEIKFTPELDALLKELAGKEMD